MSGVQVVLELGTGEIVLEVFERLAPNTAGYFLELVASGSYDGSRIYRSTSLGVPNGPKLIQGGPLAEVLAPSSANTGTRGKSFGLLEDFETTADTGLVHDEGRLSLARDLLDTGHAIPEFFVCLGRFPQLDAGGRTEPDARGFPAFGRISSGLDLLSEIAEGPTEGKTPVPLLEGEILTHPARLQRVYRR